MTWLVNYLRYPIYIVEEYGEMIIYNSEPKGRFIKINPCDKIELETRLCP
jgi:hypothetical protein